MGWDRSRRGAFFYLEYPQFWLLWIFRWVGAYITSVVNSRSFVTQAASKRSNTRPTAVSQLPKLRRAKDARKMGGITTVSLSYGLLAASLIVLFVAPAIETVFSAPAGASAPTSPPVEICGNTSVLSGPSSAPTGAVTVPAGTNSSTVGETYNLQPDTTYYLATGIHTLGKTTYGQIDPAPGDTFVGAPGAVLSGQSENQSAFGGNAKTVTIEYLTIEKFETPEDQMVVNHNGAAHWKIEHVTVETNTGAGLDLGAYGVAEYDCLTHNAQEGFESYNTTGGVRTVTLSDDEISYNDGSTKGTGPYDHGSTTCGCGGGGKFWDVKNAVVTTDYVHNNGDPGIWADTDNSGFLISHNYIADNFGAGIQYEISYNATISDNTLIRNTIPAGEANAGFPTAAIYISNSGGSSAVTSDYKGVIDITGNVFTDNWGGVALYTNSDRYCGDGYDGVCTLVTPSTYTITSCTAHLTGSNASQTPDYYDNCRWKTKTVTVATNTFNFTPQAVSPQCSVAATCGFNGVFSMWGITTPWKGWTVPVQMANYQHNVFKDNTYTGNWHFDALSQGSVATWAQWIKGLVTITGQKAAAQDAGSTFNRTGSALLGQARTQRPT
jgi:hypothetical protein